MTTERFTSVQALAAKIDWEGGVFEAAEYGIKADELPDSAPQDIRDAWERVCDACDDVNLINEWLWSND